MEFQPFSSLFELIYLIQLCDWHTPYYSVKPVYSYRLKQGNHEVDKAERGVHRSPSVTLFIQLIQQRQIGDALLAAPALELLKKRFPRADLHLFTEAKCEPLLRGNPHIDKLLLLDRRRPRAATWSWIFSNCRVAVC